MPVSLLPALILEHHAGSTRCTTAPDMGVNFALHVHVGMPGMTHTEGQLHHIPQVSATICIEGTSQEWC